MQKQHEQAMRETVQNQDYLENIRVRLGRREKQLVPYPNDRLE